MRNILCLILLYLMGTFAYSQSLMTVAQVYDFSLGDIYIYEYYSGSTHPPTYCKHIITAKWYSAISDTVFYQWDKYCYTPASCWSCSPSYDTIYGGLWNFTNLTDTIGANLGVPPHYWNPGCIDTTGYTDTWLDTIFYDPDYCFRLTTRISIMDNLGLVDSCLIPFEPFYGYKTYGQGIGKTVDYYNTCAGGYLPCVYQVKLLFYKKGADSCGVAPYIPTSLGDSSYDQMMQVFPNPVSGVLHVRYTGTETRHLSLVSLLGQEVLSATIAPESELTLSVAGIPDGIYVLTAAGELGETLYTVRICVQH